MIRNVKSSRGALGAGVLGVKGVAHWDWVGEVLDE